MQVKAGTYHCPNSGAQKPAFAVEVTKKAGKRSTFKILVLSAPDNYEIESVYMGENAGQFEPA